MTDKPYSPACQRSDQCDDHMYVMRTVERNTATLDGVQREITVMRDTQERNHTELREDMRDLKAMITRSTSANGAGIQITAGNTQSSQPGQSGGPTAADWSKLWISILLLACVVVGAWLVHLGIARSNPVAPQAPIHQEATP